MRPRTLALLAFLLLPLPAAAQVYYPPLLLRDEGSDLGRVLVALDFTGAGVSCTASNGVGTCNVTAGGGGGNFVEVSLAMTGGSGIYSTTVTGQAWVTATSKILCTAFGTTADGLTPEQVSAARLTAIASDRVVGTGFTLTVNNPHGSNGTHRFHCTGA